jgi:hypothetical protein
VPDNHWLAIELVRCRFHVVDVVGDRTGSQPLRGDTLPMRAQADCDGSKAVLGEETQKVIVPAPRAVPATVNEQQWHRMVRTAVTFVDDLEHRGRR